MKVIFRVDASLQIGTGHVMRCLCLAEALRKGGDDVEFICRQHNGSLVNKIRLAGFNVYELELLKNSKVDNKLFHSSWLGVTQQKDSYDCIKILKKVKTDWLIVDHYGLDKDWQIELKSYCKKIMVIDDLGDRMHDCNLLLDQNFGSTQAKYQGLVKKYCKIIAGPNYALLRDEFLQWRDYSLKRREKKLQINTLLVTLGGVDSDNYTEKVLQMLAKCKLVMSTEIQVVMGENSPHLSRVQNQASKMPFRTTVNIGVSNMAELMANADLAIGAAGSTTWERCCLGLPTIQLIISENQRQISEALDKINAIKLLEKLDDIILFTETFDLWFFQVKKNCKVLVHGNGSSLVKEQLNLNK